MENKRNLKTRITLLYIVYFAVLLGGVIHNTMPQFKRGAELGFDVSKNIFNGLSGDIVRTSKIFIGVRADAGREIETLELGDDKNTSVCVGASQFDFIVSQDADDGESLPDIIFNSIGGAASIYICSLVIMVLYITIFVLTFLILNSLHRSVKNDIPLAKSCVWYTRAIGLILIVNDVLDSWGQWAMAKGAAKVLEGTDFTVNTTFTLNYYTLLLAVLVIFTAEIFSIGSQLGEEQKLTI